MFTVSPESPKMDLMKTQGEDIDHFIFDCGEDDLEQCQEHHYYSKENDFTEFVETIKSYQSSFAEKLHEEAKSNSLCDASPKIHAPVVTTSSSKTIVAQAATGVGNPTGYVIFDPTSMRLVSSGNNLKVYSGTPTTATTNSSSAVATPPSTCYVQPRLPDPTGHTLPQQLTPVQYRPQIRALTPNMMNTKVVSSSPTMPVTSEQLTIHTLPQQLTHVQYRPHIKTLTPSMVNTKVLNTSPCMSATSEQLTAHTSSQQLTPVQHRPQIRALTPSMVNTKVLNTSPCMSVNSSPTEPAMCGAQTQRTYSPVQLRVNLLPNKPCPFNFSQFKIVPQSTIHHRPSAPQVPGVPLASGFSKSSNMTTQAQDVTSFISTSQAKGVVQVISTVSGAQNVIQPAPGISQAASIPKSLPSSQPVSKINPSPTQATYSTQKIDSTTNYLQSSLPLLPVTRKSPPPHSQPKPKVSLAQSSQMSHKHPKNSQVASTSSDKLGTGSEALEVVESENIANGSVRTIPLDLVDLTAEDSARGGNEIETENDSTSSNKISKKSYVKEKTFPSLVVTARSCMKVIPNAVASSERQQLDNQLRKVLQMAPQVFTEYLLQQRLLRPQQHCKSHAKNLKLGMYSDSARFPHSGGYVWISECCNAGFCSVFSGSIFDKTLQPPTSILKLMYHWSCNTAIHNVMQWVKVDNFIVKTYYTFFRAVCTAAVQEKMGLLGGARKKVQVGVISLGTSQGQGKKDVKVDILAALDTETIQLRLRALENSEPSQNKEFFEKKLRRILGILQEWVHPNSTIITDFAVDLPLCRQYGFGNVIVSGGQSSNNNNLEVISYLKNWVPKMFHNTLGLLSIQIIQQFLDELVWRERWGPIPSRAFDSLINHISEMTKLPGPDFITKLKKIASFPTKNWKFSVWKNSTDFIAADQSSTEVEVHVPQQQAPTTVTLPLEQKPKADESPVWKESISKLRTTLLSYKGPQNNKISKINEKANEKPSPSFPSTANVVLPIVDKKPEIGQPSGESTFEIDDIVSLESYYYGHINGIQKRQKYSGAFLAECTLCKRDFLTASSFTEHLIHHALNGNEAWAEESKNQLMSICKECLVTVEDVSYHIARKHPKPMSSIQTACKICNIDYKTDERLYKHMSCVHCELDMPYVCEECQYRTSIYDDAATHFKDFHDKDSCLQCPFCLKVVRFCSTGGLEIISNQHYFIQHIQKHNVSKLNKKCEKCRLSFTSMGILKSHQENFHSSGKNSLSAVRYFKNSSKFIKIKRPLAGPIPPVTLHESSFHTLKGKVLTSTFKVDSSLSNFNCAECDSPIVQNHFSVKMTCTRCTFQSHCANAIKEHSARTHLTLDVLVSKLPQIVGGNPLLEKSLYCSKCVFTSNNGNRMATHIANCKDSAVATTEKRKLSHLQGDLRLESHKRHKKR